MKSILEFINESFKQILPNEFKTILTSLFNDWDKNFNAQYSLNFIYNIIAESCNGKKAILLETAYDENGKRKENENKLFSLKAGKNILAFIEDDYGQIKIYENNDYIDTFGTVGWDNEFDFGFKLIESLQRSDNFKIKNYKYSNTQFEKDFGFSPKTYPNLIYDVQMYYVNGWKVVNGFFKNKDRSESWGNNLYGYFVYPHSSEDPLYTCYGAGGRGSKEKYEGPDENKFKETVVKILENHVHLKKK